MLCIVVVLIFDLVIIFIFLVALTTFLLPFAEQDQPNLSIESSGDEEEPDMDALFNQYLPQEPAEPPAKRRKTAPAATTVTTAAGTRTAPVQSSSMIQNAPGLPVSGQSDEQQQQLDNRIQMLIREAIQQSSSSNFEQVLAAQTRAITSAITSARQGPTAEEKVVEPRLSDESWWLKLQGHDVVDNSQTKL